MMQLKHPKAYVMANIICGTGNEIKFKLNNETYPFIPMGNFLKKGSKEK